MRNSERIKIMAATKRQAEQALRQVRAQFKAFLDENEVNNPQLIKDWDWCETPTRWAIVWESGPYDWAMLAEHGGTTEFGTMIPAAKAWPKGTYAEPVTGWAIGVCEI